MEHINLFPTVISSILLEDISNNEIEGYIHFLNQKEWIIDSPGSGYINATPDILEEDIFSKLKSNILNLSKEYFKNLGFTDLNFRISDSWVNLLNTGEDIKLHLHRNSFLSGVFYLNSSSAEISFENPISDKWLFYTQREQQDIEKPQTWEFFRITPQKNQLLLFPSWLLHEVPEKCNEDGRISIAFNLVPTGKIGFNTSSLTL